MLKHYGFDGHSDLYVYRDYDPEEPELELIQKYEKGIRGFSDMKKSIFFLPILLFLAGCPGKGREGAESGETTGDLRRWQSCLLYRR